MHIELHFDLRNHLRFNLRFVALRRAPLWFGAGLCALVCAGCGQDQTPPASPPAVTISAAWVRAAVPGQQATGGYMTLTSPAAAKLVAVQTAAAGVAEIHEMTMEGDVMRMRPLPSGLPLPAGQPVALRPGAQHLMLMDLRGPLVSGSSLTVTLTFEDAQGRRSQQTTTLPVALMAPGPTASKP